MNYVLIRTIFIILFVFPAILSPAQKAGPGLSVHSSFLWSPLQDFSDSSGGYSISKAEAGLRFPIIRKYNEDKDRFFALLMNMNGSLTQLEVQGPGISAEIYGGSAGVSGFWHFKKKNNILISLRSAIAEEKTTLDDPRLKTGGSFIYSRKSSERFSLILGLAAANNYNNFRVLPVLGMKIRPGEKSSIGIIFPLRFDWKYRPVKQVGIGLSLSPNGEHARIAASDSTDDSYQVRIRHFDLSASLKYMPGKRFSAELRGGIMMLNRFSLSGPAGTTRYKADAGPCIRLSLVYRFPRTRRITEADDDNDDDEMLDELDTDDLLNY